MLEFFNHPEGYIEPENDGSFTFVYQYKDHLGNIRLSYKDINGNGVIATNEIIEEKNYYPFGLQHKGYNNTITGREHPYGYNGKEEQNELGLNWMDYGARNYDASIGRFVSLDPASEIYNNWTPYHYVMNNPIIFIDPTGMFTELFDENGNKIGEDENGDDGNVSIITNKDDAERIKNNTENGELASQDDIDGGVTTTKAVLREALNVLKRTRKNGGDDEETSLVMNDGTVLRGEGSGNTGTIPAPPEGKSDDDAAASIHSHPLNYIINERNNAVSYSALRPSEVDTEDSSEQIAVFNRFQTNVIVGRLGPTVAQFNKRGKAVVKKKNIPGTGVVVYKSIEKSASLTKRAAKNIIRN